MREFWAVVGKVLVDEEFYAVEIFPLCGFHKTFEDLDGLRSYLLKDLQLGFSRWEVMRLNQIATERVQGDVFVEVKLPVEEVSIAEVRSGWVEPPPSLRDQFDLCSVIGLAAMDTNFRAALHDASRKEPADISALKKFLEESVGDTPVFKLSETDLRILNKFMRSLVDSLVSALTVFHQTNWVLPEEKACDGGATKTKAKYDYFSQNGLNLLLLRESHEEAGITERWKEARAIL